MDAGTISVLIALVGCFVGLAGWLSGRDKKISNDAEWKGAINAKLDVICGVTQDIKKSRKPSPIMGSGFRRSRRRQSRPTTGLTKS